MTLNAPAVPKSVFADGAPPITLGPVAPARPGRVPGGPATSARPAMPGGPAGLPTRPAELW